MFTGPHRKASVWLSGYQTNLYVDAAQTWQSARS